MACFTTVVRIIVAIIILTGAVLPVSQIGQGAVEAVPISSLYRTLDVTSFASAETWPNHNETRPSNVMRTRMPVMGYSKVKHMSSIPRFLSGFDLNFHHILPIFGAILVSKFALVTKKNRIVAQEEIDRSIAKEHIKNLERNHAERFGHVGIRTRRGYCLIEDDVEIVVHPLHPYRFRLSESNQGHLRQSAALPRAEGQHLCQHQDP